MRKGDHIWWVQGCLLHTICSADTLTTEGPWVPIQCQCLGLQIVECLIHCMPSVSVTVAESSWLAICSDKSGEQLGKDMMWHDITTCFSVDFASEASTLIGSNFSRHGDSCYIIVARLIKESIFIRVNNPTLNRNIGKFQLSHIWYGVLFGTPNIKVTNPKGKAQHSP